MDLCTGEWRARFEPENGMLREIRFGGCEVLRAVYAAVRDERWGTVPPRLTGVETREIVGGLSVEFDAACVVGAVDFRWHARLELRGDGSLAYEMHGQAMGTFARNRIGLCVLHPTACAGQPCTVEHGDGRMEPGAFPREISPHQPFFDVRVITHEPVPGLRVTVRMEGETFEMEDQRNWTDASFKTYGTPLAAPFPVQVQAGDEVVQRVEVAVTRTGKPPIVRGSRRGLPVVELIQEDAARVTLPAIGLGMTTAAPVPWGEREVKQLKRLRPAHLRVDADPADPEFRRRLARAEAEAWWIGAGLELALFLDDPPGDDLETLAGSLAGPSCPATVRRCLVFDRRTRRTAARATVEAVRGLLPGVQVGGGVDADFVELNRQRSATEGVDLVNFAVNPQVHAFDDRSLVETLETQGTCVQNARRWALGKPVIVSPVTLRPRALGVADPRQRQPFAAAWTLGSLKYLAEAGAKSVTFHETTGPHGVMMNGELFPVGRVLEALAPFAGGTVFPVRSGDPWRAVGLLVERAGKRQLFVSFFEAATVSFTLSGGERLTIPGAAWSVAIRDVSTA